MPAADETPWPQLGVTTPADLERHFAALRARFAADADSGAPARELRDRWLGRKNGVLARVKEHWLAPAPADWKKQVGREYNALARHVEARLTQALAGAEATERSERLRAEAVDATLPGHRRATGPAHPVTAMMERLAEVFLRLGYSVAEGPEIETAYFNFEALNIPPDHPARAEQDTLYLKAGGPGGGEEGGAGGGELLLRTHTSPVQIRAMRRQSPPLRVIAPGRVYRRDAPDATHSPMFHQLEGLAIDHDLTLGDLKGALDHFAREIFGGGARTRFRPSYFPFTEPSAEMDVSCLFCSGGGCRACKQSGWIEILGCGMVHPALYEFAGYEDAGRWSGFAFGMGVERIAMLCYGVDDIQRFYSGDLRFLEQFA